MNEALFETLLHESEGTSLDFKEGQYQFIKAADEEKSELLKDILAFANSFRRDDAYILIGVREVKGGRSIPVGIPDDLDDSSLQQFINNKTNRKLEFSYKTFSYQGLKFGIINIPRQPRPTYLKADFGKLKKETVYYRIGSSTDIANPDEVARMARTDLGDANPDPVLHLELGDHKTRRAFGNSITLSMDFHEQIDPALLPNYSNVDGPFLTDAFSNSNYWREMASFVFLRSILRPVGFIITNGSETLVRNVNVEFEVPQEQILLLDEVDLPRRPSTKLHDISMPYIRSQAQETTTRVRRFGDKYKIVICFGSIQPKAKVWSEEPLYVAPKGNLVWSCDAIIYADNIRQPQKASLTINMDVTMRPALTVEDLEAYEDHDD